MKNVDLKIHRAKLSLIRYRLYVIYGAFLFLWAFSFAMGFIVLGKLQTLAEEIREGQKGNTCILLIRPENRTKQNLRECIENNKTKNDVKFDFKESKDNQENPNFKLSLEPPFTGEAQPIQIQQRPIFEPIAPRPVPEEPKKPEVIKKTVELVKEYRTNPLSGLEEWRYKGDTFWSLVNVVE